jgi:hypothetical protein
MLIHYSRYNQTGVVVETFRHRISVGFERARIVIIIHLLGLAPAGWVTAPDKRPNVPSIHRCDGCHAVPLNLLTRRTTRKPPRRKKITTRVLEWLPFATHVSFCPEPAAGRKPPALLALSISSSLVACGYMLSGVPLGTLLNLCRESLTAALTKAVSSGVGS